LLREIKLRLFDSWVIGEQWLMIDSHHELALTMGLPLADAISAPMMRRSRARN